MDRINRTGKNLIEYKVEYSKHHSQIVDNALEKALDSLIIENVLSSEMYENIISDTYPLDKFKIDIATDKKYIKNNNELFAEFEKIRLDLNEALKKNNFTKFIETESNIDNNRISILKQYTLPEDFFKTYFGLEQKDIVQVMKKKGFGEKFAVLRLGIVFKEIFSEMRTCPQFTQSYSKVYYNENYNGFSVDYKYNIDIDYINKDRLDEIILKIIDTDKVVERKFAKKTGIAFYNLPSLQPIKDNLNISANVPNSKLNEVDVSNIDKDKYKVESDIQEEDVKIETESKIESETTELNNEPNIDEVLDKIENETDNITNENNSSETTEKISELEDIEVDNNKINEEIEVEDEFAGFVAKEENEGLEEEIDFPDIEIDNI